MSNTTLIRNAKLVNEGEIFDADLLIKDQVISEIRRKDSSQAVELDKADREIDAGGKYLLPGVIDDQVHFRDPGLTHKGDLKTESKAAIAGGITSFMDMPNTVPKVLTQDLLQQKYDYAEGKTMANYSFYMGTSNDNVDEVLKTDPKNVCGVKVFMGASTGNMLVDDEKTLAKVFAECPTLIATHCEDEKTIQANIEKYKKEYGDEMPVEMHPKIRDEESCYKSSSLAVGLARKYGSRLHVLHLTTAREMSHFSNGVPLSEKRITAEVCVHHLWFSDEDYKDRKSYIRWNPSIKAKTDRDALRKALNDDVIDVVATDHAPHTFEEKQNPYFTCPSGGPLVQHALPAMLEMSKQGVISLEKLVQKMCHAPADCYKIHKRGYLREGYCADLVLVDMENSSEEVAKSNILYKCGWSPFEGIKFNSRLTHTFVNGHLAYENGNFDDSKSGKRLVFDR